MGLCTQQGLRWGETLMESTTLDLTKPAPTRRNQQQQQQQQQQRESLECPRCGSTNTKFCYYNNYNKSQPRHFCRACKRHWTKGGTLRNVPVGGGRKNKRGKVSNADTAMSRPETGTGTTTTTNLSSVVIPTSGISGLYSSTEKSISDTLFHSPSALQNDHAINSFLEKSPIVSNDTFSGCYSPNPKPQIGSTLMPYQDQSIQISFPNSNIGSSITTPCQKPKGYDQFERFDTSIESTITTVVPTTSSILSQPWQNPSTSATMDVPSYWNWDDMDSLVPTHDLDIPPWNDTEIKF